MGSPQHFVASKSKDPTGLLSWWQWTCGMLLASIFTMTYFLAPLYMISALAMIYFRYPCWHAAWLFASPLLISAIVPSISSPWMLKQLTPLLYYFEYEQILETSPIDGRKEMQEHGKQYILACQPHGVLSFTGICSAIVLNDGWRGKIPTGVATALLYTPLLKHVMGIFWLVSASKASLKRHFRKYKGDGIQGSMVLYVGGMAELFLSHPEEETLYLKNRKGFIKLALQEGVDVIPIYMFGNTSILSVLQSGWLAKLSRKYQLSLTYFWGRWGLPIPRDEKVSMFYKLVCRLSFVVDCLFLSFLFILMGVYRFSFCF